LVRQVRRAKGAALSHPGLLLLHGRGADEHDLFSFADALDERLVVVSPRAPLPLMGGYMWYEIGPAGRSQADGLNESLAALAALLDEMVEQYAVDPRRLFILGFSQGAAMAGSLLLTTPERVAGAALLSGYIPIDAGLDLHPEALGGKPVFVAHGTQDTVIPVQVGRMTRDFMQANGAALTYREYPTGHGIGARELEDVLAWLAPLLAAS
jgi:phospholipase/carboxylesterase